MWKEIIRSNSEDCAFNSPVNEKLFVEFKDSLDIELPRSLKSCLIESNGVLGEYGLGLIWSIDKIIHENLSFRSNEDFKELYMPFDHVLFFADAGNGDQFFYPIQNGEIRRDDVFSWNHEDDSRCWVAPSLEKYIEWWLSGKIEGLALRGVSFVAKCHKPHTAPASPSA
jgi:hypothetical protein